MKKLITLLTTCLLAVNAWGDVSVVEKFSQIDQIAAVASDSWNADVCTWSTAYARHRKGTTYMDGSTQKNNDDIITVTEGSSTSSMYSVWMNAANNTKRGCIQTTNWEGGIKAVSFRWAQFGAEQSDCKLKLEVKVGETVDESADANNLKREGQTSGNRASGGILYSHAFNCKSNDVQLNIKNISTGTVSGTSTLRILVGNITITPYLRYQQKAVTIGLPNKGYINRNLIDNTDGEGNIEYSIDDDDVADIDSETGALSPKKGGTATITATWTINNNVVITTSYDLIVDGSIYVETFTQHGTPESSLSSVQFWESDVSEIIPSWRVWQANQGAADTIGGLYVQGTYLRTTAATKGYIKTSSALEGGVKKLSFDWKQGYNANGSNLYMAVYLNNGEDYKVKEDTYEGDNKSPRADIWTCEYDGSPTSIEENCFLEFRNNSTRGSGSNDKDPRLVIGAIKITPFLLYYEKQKEWDIRGEGNEAQLYRNNALIKNVEGIVVYSIVDYGGIPEDKISIVNDGEYAGTIIVADRHQSGTIVVQAGYNENKIYTTYTLQIIGKEETSASFAKEIVRGDLKGTITNALTITPNNYDGTVIYSSSNTDVATFEGSTISIHGVGITTITATIPETDNFQESSVSYKLYITDANACKETFAGITTANEVANSEVEWIGQLFKWQALQVRRYPSSDTIWNTTTLGTWIRTNKTTQDKKEVAVPGYLQTKNNVEGGIKHLSLYWKQWGAESGKKLRLAVYAGNESSEENRADYIELDPDSEHSAGYCCFEKFLFGANNVMQSNKRLIIRNESYIDADEDGFDESEITTSNSRMIIDTIYITPWLLYTTKEATMNICGENLLTYKNEGLIDNTGETVTYSITNYGGIPTDKISISNEGEDAGTITVTDRYQTGDIEVQAKWSDVTTTYTLHVVGKMTIPATFNELPIRIGLDAQVSQLPTVELNDYDGMPIYSNKRADIATIDAENGVTALVGVGQDTITATLPETDNFGPEKEVSYVLYVRDNNARKETFSIVTADGVVGNTLTPWAGDLFDWQARYQVRRKSGDNINEGTANPHLGTSIGIQNPEGTPISSFLKSKAPVEGGIKYLSFYWSQWNAAYNSTRRIRVYAGETLIGSSEHPNGASGVNGDEFLLGINGKVKSNQQLIIKNESYEIDSETGNEKLSTASNNSRIVIGVIEITPYLLYTNKAHTMRVGDAPYVHPLDNNTDEGTITYSLVPSDSKVASIDPSTGEVTVLKAGEVTVKATWSEGAYTTYRLSVKPRQTNSLKVETFPNATDATYLTGVSSIAQDQSTWTYRQAGFNSNENFTANVAFIRKHHTNEDKQSYIQSAEISGGIQTLAFDWNIVGNEPDVERWDIRMQIKQGETLKKEIRLTSDAGDVLENVHKRNDGWRSAVLTDINVADDFIIRIENKSEIQGEYTSGNKARFVIDNIEWKATEDIVLNDDGTNNAEMLATYNGKDAEVQLADRTIRTGGYNTLCLPFALSEEQLAESPLAGGKVFNFTNAYLGADNLDIRFEKVSAMEAGKPYLVVVPEDKVNPVFENVTIDNATAANVTKGDNMWFRGAFNQETMNETGLYVVANSLYRVSNITSGDKTIGACRAYFDVPDGSPAIPAGIRMRITEEEVATDLVTVSGERLSVTGVQKVIRDGQLLIIRDGRTYNAQGALVK